MAEALRLILLIALGAAALTTAVLAFAWWMEPERRLRRAMSKALASPPETEAYAPSEGRAAGLDFDNSQVLVLWNGGARGLLYAFEEVEGGEIIVDGHVLARVRRGQPTKALDVLAPEAEHVVLRLLFDDGRHPEFELSLWEGAGVGPIGSPSEALRLGRRWLSHLEALLKA